MKITIEDKIVELKKAKARAKRLTGKGYDWYNVGVYNGLEYALSMLEDRDAKGLMCVVK